MEQILRQLVRFSGNMPRVSTDIDLPQCVNSLCLFCRAAGLHVFATRSTVLGKLDNVGCDPLEHVTDATLVGRITRLGSCFTRSPTTIRPYTAMSPYRAINYTEFSRSTHTYREMLWYPCTMISVCLKEIHKIIMQKRVHPDPHFRSLLGPASQRIPEQWCNFSWHRSLCSQGQNALPVGLSSSLLGRIGRLNISERDS